VENLHRSGSNVRTSGPIQEVNWLHHEFSDVLPREYQVEDLVACESPHDEDGRG